MTVFFLQLSCSFANALDIRGEMKIYTNSDEVECNTISYSIASQACEQINKKKK